MSDLNPEALLVGRHPDSKFFFPIQNAIYRSLTLVEPLTAFDAKVAAVIDGWVITTPNMSFVPLPPWGKRFVHARADMRFADDDFTLWTQPYDVKYSHLGAVPKKTEDPADPLAIMWWTPAVDDFELMIGNRETGLGLITASKRNQIDHLIDSLIIRVDSYREAAERPNAFMLLVAKILKHAQDRLNTLPATFTNAKFAFVEIQRLYLEASGCIDYLEFFVPIMDGKKPAATQVDETRIGAFTPDPETVQSFFRAGLPVWYLRRFDKIIVHHPPNVLTLVTALKPTNLVYSPSDPPSPLIYEGMENLEKQNKIRNFTRSRLYNHDPFSDEKPSSYVGAPRLPSHSTTVPAGKLLQRPSRSLQDWSASRRSSASSSSPSSSQPSSQPSRAQKQGKGKHSISYLIYDSLIILQQNLMVAATSLRNSSLPMFHRCDEHGLMPFRKLTGPGRAEKRRMIRILVTMPFQTQSSSFQPKLQRSAIVLSQPGPARVSTSSSGCGTVDQLPPMPHGVISWKSSVQERLASLEQK
jgi:hypothetical protein